MTTYVSILAKCRYSRRYTRRILCGSNWRKVLGKNQHCCNRYVVIPDVVISGVYCNFNIFVGCITTLCRINFLVENY